MPTFSAKRVVSYRTSITKDGMFGLQLIDEHNRGATIEHILDRSQALGIAKAIWDARDARKLAPVTFLRHTALEPQPSERDENWHHYDGD